jgi:lysophospholipase L1-like esterase
MRSLSLVLFTFFAGLFLNAQSKFSYIPEASLTTYYQQRASLFSSLPQTSGDIIFLGNSITDGGEWSEMFNDLKIKNRGISGDISAGVLNRLEEVIDRKPAKLFVMIGINDLANGTTPDSLVKNIFTIADQMREQSPNTRLFIQSLLPKNNFYGKFDGHTKRGNDILVVNKCIQENASVHKYHFIDLFSYFKNNLGKLDTS